MCVGVYRVLVYVVMVVCAGRSIGEWSTTLGGACAQSLLSSYLVLR